jgi:Fur family ferric uptake transcriptional regulator
MSAKRLRMTKQRRIILDELGKTREHPSAADVYEKVKRRLPHISLGTVYRNLETLSSQGVVRRLEMGSGQRRFDPHTENHHHIRCMVCGRIDDVSLVVETAMGSLITQAGLKSGYEMTGMNLDLFGVCPECSLMGAKRNAQMDVTRKK